MREQQFISYKLKAVSLKEDASREFINLAHVRFIRIKDTRIDFFQTYGDHGITIEKEDHPTVYEAIRHFLVNRLQGNNNIIDEDPEGK